MTSVGIISDTHNLLRSGAIEALKESDLIIHAGDIGSPEIIDTLRLTAPVHAVRGNTDHALWAKALPLSHTIKITDKTLYIMHNLQEINFNPEDSDFDIVVSGHSHIPGIKKKNGVLYINPGSAGPRRFTLPISIAKLTIDTNSIHADLIDIPV